MAWTITHNGTDITSHCWLSGMSLSAGAVAGGRTVNLKIIPTDSGFAPERSADIVFYNENGDARWRGRIESVDFSDMGAVAGITDGQAYDVTVNDIGTLMSRRIVPPAGSTAQREARTLPPRAEAAKYDGTFRPLSTATSVPAESALDWALALIETTEAANVAGGKERLIPAFQVGTASGSGFQSPALRGPGHTMTDLTRFPAAGSVTYTASSNAGTAGNAADGDAATYWQAGSGANPSWTALFSADQIISYVTLKAGPTTAWTDLRVDLRDSAAVTIATVKFGAVAVGATKTYQWQGDVPGVRSVVVRDASTSTASGRGLATVSTYDTMSIFQTKQARASSRTGNVISAEAFTYAELVGGICDLAQLGWYVDPGDVSGPILRVYSLTNPGFADFEIGDDPAQTPISAAAIKMARTINLTESSANIINRVTAQYGASGATLSVTVPDDPGTRRGLAAQARVSQTLYGLREKRLGDNNAKTKKDALINAQRELARALGPEVAGEVRLPYDPAIVPGYRVRVHRGQHLPAVAPKDYYVATAFIRDVNWVFETGASTPTWCDITLGDPDGNLLGFVEGLTGATDRLVGRTANKPSGIQRSSDEVEAPAEVEWGTYSTYVVGGFTGSNGRPYQVPPYSRDRTTYRYDVAINGAEPAGGFTWADQAYYLPTIKGAHTDASGRRSLAGGSNPVIFGIVPPAASGAVIRARLFLPIDRIAGAAKDLPTELTVRLVQVNGGTYATSVKAFGDSLNTNPTDRNGWIAATGNRVDLKSGTFASVRLADDDSQMLQFDIPWPTSTTTGEGLNDIVWAIVGPSDLLAVAPVPLVTGGNINQAFTTNLLANAVEYWPGLDFSRQDSPNTVTSTYLWDVNDPAAGGTFTPGSGLGFDPRTPDAGESRAYAMLMVNTGAILSAAPGSYVERTISFTGDRVKSVDLGQPIEPGSLTVFINGVRYREDRGHYELVTSGDNITGFNVSRGTAPCRPLGLRQYKLKNGKWQVDTVVVRYRVG
jgi:hypothetical protein